jgi:hypothetical protein
MAPATVGAKVKLSMTGVTDLPAGTVVLAREGKAVAGKVVSATAAGGGLDVVLETIPLLALFKRLDVEASYDIDPAAMALALAMPPRPTMAVGRPGDGVQAIQQPFKLGSKIECESKFLGGALTGNASVDLRPNMTFTTRFLRNDDTGQWTELMVKLDGKLTVSGSVSLEFSPMLAGTASCSATLVKIPIPIGGPLAAVLGLKVPLGIKGEVGGALALAPLKAGLELTGESMVTLGFQYLNGVTNDLGKLTNKFELEPTFTLPGGESPGATLMAHAAFGGSAGLDVAVLFGLGSFSLLEASLLMNAEVKTGPINKGFAFGAAYDLRPTLEVGPGEDAEKALSWLGGAVALKPAVSVELPVIAKSPRGTLTADKMMAKPEEPVKLTVNLEADSLKFLGLDNAVDVRLYRSPKLGGTGLELMETQAAAAGKTSYSFTWTPTFQDMGTIYFWAGVSSRLAPGLALEVNDKSVVMIQVGQKGKRWKGTVTTECFEDKSDPGSTDTFTTKISSTLMLEHETEEDALNAKTKVTGSATATEKMTHDYTYMGMCSIKVHEETISTATELMPVVFQTKFHEDTGMYNLVGVAYVSGTRHMTHTESGSCKNPPTTTSPPDGKYTTNFGYMINGMVAPGSDSFSGTMTTPDDKGMCTWTWNFARAQ